MHFDEDLQGDEGVRQWERAVELADSFDTLAANTGLGNHAVRQLILGCERWDASGLERRCGVHGRGWRTPATSSPLQLTGPGYPCGES